MKQTILYLTLLLLGTLAAQAQGAKNAIRKHYSDAKAQIARIQELEKSGDQYPVPQTYTVVVKQNLPATGYHEETLQMFYREEKESDEQIYADIVNGIDYEYRFYFSQGRLIDVIVKSRQTGKGETAFKAIYQGKTVPAQYSEEYKNRVASSKSIMTVFKSIDSNRHL